MPKPAWRDVDISAKDHRWDCARCHRCHDPRAGCPPVNVWLIAGTPLRRLHVVR
jgi:hypothetical protein